jgi:hypothetical protein
MKSMHRFEAEEYREEALISNMEQDHADLTCQCGYKSVDAAEAADHGETCS